MSVSSPLVEMVVDRVRLTHLLQWLANYTHVCDVHCVPASGTLSTRLLTDSTLADVHWLTRMAGTAPRINRAFLTETLHAAVALVPTSVSQVCWTWHATHWSIGASASSAQQLQNALVALHDNDAAVQLVQALGAPHYYVQLDQPLCSYVALPARAPTALASAGSGGATIAFSAMLLVRSLLAAMPRKPDAIMADASDDAAALDVDEDGNELQPAVVAAAAATKPKKTQPIHHDPLQPTLLLAVHTHARKLGAFAGFMNAPGNTATDVSLCLADCEVARGANKRNPHDTKWAKHASAKQTLRVEVPYASDAPLTFRIGQTILHKLLKLASLAPLVRLTLYHHDDRALFDFFEAADSAHCLASVQVTPAKMYF